MKKPKDITDLASRLSNAAATPLVQSAPEATAVESLRERPRKTPNRGSVSVFLRVPPELYKQFDDEAVSRTKATGRGVTVQQVILDKLTVGHA
jgi:hypothetical protein